jgi:hypothetical protein
VSKTERNGEPWKPRRDDARSVKHDLGFVPMAWVRNLPGGSGPDGACTFFPAIDTQMEIEYQLSQAGRGLRYSSDPLLLIKEPSGSDSSFVRSAANAIRVDEKGDAKLLEIDGGAAEAVISYARACREMALEAVHGNRSTPDKAGMAQSGRALELMHQPLIWLAGRLRASYGNALLSLVRMALAAAEKMDVEVAGEPFRLPSGTRVSLRWGHWFAPTQHDKLEEAQALQHNAQAGHISRKTAVGLVCETHDIPDAAAELQEIEADQAEADARTARLAEVAAKSQVNVNDPVNG